jgi:RND family efflux transporter MFP subunit
MFPPVSTIMDNRERDLSSLRIDREGGASRPAPRSGGGGRWIVVVIALLITGAAIAAFLVRGRPIEVRTVAAEVTGGSMSAGGGITANGYVVARTKASVAAKIAGRLAFLGVSEGSLVRKGEIIARLESADVAAAVGAARATVAETDAQLVQAHHDLDRAHTLRTQDLVSDVEVENAQTKVHVFEAQVAADRARLALAQANLENTNVRAPFDGTVLRKDAEVGEIVAPSSAGGGLTRTAIVTMADLATLEVEVDVNEAYIAQVTNAQPARITLDAYPDTSFSGRVRQVVPTADRQKATVQVKVSILDRDPRILPEMGAKVEFVREQNAPAAALTAPRRVLVPAAAVVPGAGGARVWELKDGRAVARAVEVGVTRGDRVEIRSGLEGGEQLIVAPPAGLKDGAKVRVRTSQGG